MFFSLSSTIRTVFMASLPYRQGDGESGPFAKAAGERDPAAVQLDKALGEREPEAGALGLARVVAPDLLELLEHRRLVLGRDADAGVLHGDGDIGGVELRADVDAPAVGRELHRVGKQVEQDLLHLAL